MAAYVFMFSARVDFTYFWLEAPSNKEGQDWTKRQTRKERTSEHQRKRSKVERKKVKEQAKG